MQVRNLLIAAGTALAGMTAIAAVPATASAQEYRPIYRAEYAPPAPAYRPDSYGYGRAREFHRYEARRYWEHRRFEEYRFHHHPYRYW